ncbi:MAG: hypothetical protein QM831_25490 [Kofleriaceae bacterium]
MKWLWLMLVACGSDPHGSSTDAPAAIADSPAALDACPTTGSGALTPSDATCLVFTPADAGADPAGENATVNNYALAPTGTSNGKLVLYLNPSLGTPAFSIATPTDNIYTAATANGDHVLALAYASKQVIGVVCGTDNACYLDTRMTIVTGIVQPHADASVAGVTESVGIYARALAGLNYLVAHDPSGHWDQFLAGGDIDWTKVIVMGHSQGGGHAALLAKLQPVARLVALSSPCDRGAGSTAAAWQTHDSTWASDPAQIGFGYDADGDTTCDVHIAVWDALGLDPNRRFNDVATCAAASLHTATTQCTANIPRVQAMLAN